MGAASFCDTLTSFKYKTSIAKDTADSPARRGGKRPDSSYLLHYFFTSESFKLVSLVKD
jgi:hypothetical protein